MSAFPILLVTVLVAFLVIALVVSMLERSGGYVGDSSLVPSVLGLAVFTMIVISVVGYLNGNIGVWIK